MPRDASLSRILASLALVICSWGLIATLVLELVELRGVFVDAGQGRLRLATMAFAMGVVLIQRLAREQGPTVARAYAWLLGGTIGLFSVWHAYTFRTAYPPWGVFAVNAAILSVLGWAGSKVTAACSIDSPEELRTAGETGILATLRRKKQKKTPEAPRQHRPIEFSLPVAPAPHPELSKEDRWSQRLSQHGHPGRVLLFFSLAAMPLFGLGLALFPEAGVSRLRLAVLLFLYLWCAFSLLCLAGMNQLRAYFEQRDLSLPDTVGLTWLAVGFIAVTALMLAAVMLPQPPTVAGVYLRERVTNAYHLAERRAGIEPGGSGSSAETKSGQGAGGSDASGPDTPQTESEWVVEHQNKRYENIDKMNDPFLSNVARLQGVEQDQAKMLALSAAVHDSFDETFQFIMKVMVWVVIVVGIFLALVAVMVIFRQIGTALSGLRLMRQKVPPKPRRKKRAREDETFQPVHFRQFRDPFSWSGCEGDLLVRYLWEALLAWCEDAGSPCPTHLTPMEFVTGQPAALAGFEAQARFIAGCVTWSEFSGQRPQEAQRASLQRFWTELQAFVAAAGSRQADSRPRRHWSPFSR